MAGYLLNVSAIWLLSLLCFDLFLKREPYHTMNRAYLLLTLVLGMLVPLLTWPQAADQYSYVQVIRQPLYTPIDHARQAVTQTVAQTVTAHRATAFSWIKLITWLYLGGVLSGCLLLLKNIVQLARYYYAGVHTRQGKWLIVETHKAHGPFSLAHIIFISSKKDYTPEQLAIVLRHEQQHGRLFHLADLLLIQLLLTVLWFHPLVYLYRRRLLLVHEYQADAVAAQQPQDYGHFLIEQSMLGRSPSLTHSFNRSPVHKRIHMLIHNQTPQMHFMKLLVIIPVIIISFVCCTRARQDVAPSKNATGPVTRIVHFNGNEIVFKETQLAGINMALSDTGQVFTRYPKMISMVTLNGKKIFEKVDNKPEIIGSNSFAEYLFDKLKDELANLDDGYYAASIGEMLIDENGKVAYFNRHGIDVTSKQTTAIGYSPRGKGTIVFDVVNDLNGQEMDIPAQTRINRKIAEAMNEVRFTPATVKGQNVPYLPRYELCNTRLYHVVQHKAMLEDYVSSNNGQDTIVAPF